MPIDAEWTKHLENILLEFQKNENKHVDLNTINGCFDEMVCAVVGEVGSTLRDLYVGEDVSYSNFLCDEGMSPEVGVLTDVSIVEVARWCSKLKWLDVSGCSTLTNVSVVEVASKCSNVEYTGARSH